MKWGLLRFGLRGFGMQHDGGRGSHGNDHRGAEEKQHVSCPFKVPCRINGVIWRLVSLMSAERSQNGSLILSSCFTKGVRLKRLGKAARGAA
jgi:hypothetical protein